MTRRAIADSARRLFAQRGYFATKVDDIAADARVSPATVYAVTGGKQGLLNTLIDEWTQAPIVAEYTQRFDQLDDSVEIIRSLAAMTRTMREDYGDIMRVVLATAPHDDAVTKGLAIGTGRYRDGLALVAQRLADLGALAKGIDVPDATDLLWFYFGYAAFFTLVDENGWSFDRAQQWLANAAVEAVLAPEMTEPTAPIGSSPRIPTG
jgi:AcrR family transcriptional regulator